MGCSTTIIAAHISMIFTKSDDSDKKVESSLIAPFARMFLKHDQKSESVMLKDNRVIITHTFEEFNVKNVSENE